MARGEKLGIDWAKTIILRNNYNTIYSKNLEKLGLGEFLSVGKNKEARENKSNWRRAKF